MANLSLYRKRFIPNEIIPLKDDVILYEDDDIIVTKWNSLRPKSDLHHGYSCYYLKKGWKVSKFLYEDDSLMYWYCDIVEFHYPDQNSLIVTDLLADVIIHPDNTIRVVDLDELSDARQQELITQGELYHALNQLNELLCKLYAGGLKDLTSPIEKNIT